MAGAAAGMVLGGAAAARISSRHYPAPAKLTPSQNSLSSDDFFSCRNETKSALLPSCLFSAGPSCSSYASSPRRSHHRALVPSSLYSFSLPSWSHSSFIGSSDLKIVGLAVGLSGKFIQDLRREVGRRGSRAAAMNVRSMAGQSEGVIEDLIKSKNAKNAVVVYSKTWCPYSSRVKNLFVKLGVSFELVELDQLGAYITQSDESFQDLNAVIAIDEQFQKTDFFDISPPVDELDVQEGLRRLTQQSTVPSIFIGGKHIGGCDDTLDLHSRGELIPALEAAGAKITAS